MGPPLLSKLAVNDFEWANPQCKNMPPAVSHGPSFDINLCIGDLDLNWLTACQASRAGLLGDYVSFDDVIACFFDWIYVWSRLTFACRDFRVGPLCNGAIN